LFIRNCYRDLATIILDGDIRRSRITDNPGIGKTYFGYYLLYLLARRGNTILYKSSFKESLHVFDDEITFRTYDKIIVDSYKTNRNVWYIVDGKEPEKVNAKTILVCSSKKSYYANFDKYPHAKIRFLPELSLEEIHKCRNGLFPSVDKEKVDK
jgi:hypothetical protein